MSNLIMANDNSYSDISKEIATTIYLKESVLVKDFSQSTFFDVVSSSLAIENSNLFIRWAQNELQYILPHGGLICGLGQIKNHDASIIKYITSNISAEYMQTLREIGGMKASPVFTQWFNSRAPVLFESNAQQTQTAWLSNLKSHGFSNVAAHGQTDLNSPTTSYFSFFNIPGKLNSHHVTLLKLLTPHLHSALIRAFYSEINEVKNKNMSRFNGLTEREFQVLQWLSSGKTNWEIAQIFELSEYTIKNHVQNILLKLKVSTRAQAVAQLIST